MLLGSGCRCAGPGQQVVEAVDWMPCGKAAQHVGEPGFRVDGVQFPGLDQRCDDGPMVAAAV